MDISPFPTGAPADRFFLLFFAADAMIRYKTAEGGGTMPNIKSAKKRVKIIAVKTDNNKAANTELKTDIKKAVSAIEAGDADKAQAVKAAVKKIDQASAKGILHKNNAARKKSALVRKLNANA
jgi:small subunit ribosomal protein S20